jgi:hypothetical protein
VGKPLGEGHDKLWQGHSIGISAEWVVREDDDHFW